MIRFTVVTTALTWAAVAFAFGDATTAAVDPNALVQQLWSFVRTGHYAAALGPGIMIAVWLLRKYDLSIPKIGPALDAFFNQPLVAFCLPTILAAFGGFGTAVAAGQPLKDAIEPIIEAAGSAIVTFVMLKQAGQQLASVKLSSDGATAPAPSAPPEVKP